MVDAAIVAHGFLTDDRAARLAAAEAALIKALSLAPQHAAAHLLLGDVQMFTNRAAQGIAECERALALDRNLANAHAFIGRGQVSSRSRRGDRGPCPRGTPPLSSRYLRLRWMMFVGLAKMQLGADAEAVAWLRREHRGQPKFPRRAFLSCRCAGAARRAGRGAGRRASGTCARPDFTISPLPRQRRRATIRLTSPDASASMRACAWPGCRRGDVAMGQSRHFANVRATSAFALKANMHTKLRHVSGIGAVPAATAR